MGTTQTTLQLLAKDAPVETLRDLTRAALESVMAGMDFVACDEASSQQQIKLVTAPGSPWISMFPDRRAFNMPDLAPAIAQAAGLVVEMSVYDSDVLALKLYQQGHLHDEFSDWAKYDRSPRQRIGQASRWQAVLPDRVTPDDLERAWSPDEVEDEPGFASESALYRVMDLLQLAHWRFHGLDDMLPADAQVTTLHFRYKHTLPYDQLAGGLPVFQISSYNGGHRRKKKIGTRDFSHYRHNFSFYNTGGATKGFAIILQGALIRQGCIEPGRLTQAPLYPPPPTLAMPEKFVAVDGETKYRYMLRDYEIGAGADWTAIEVLPMHVRDFGREMQLRMQIMLEIELKLVQEGAGDLTTIIVALANRSVSPNFTGKWDIAAKYNP